MKKSELGAKLRLGLVVFGILMVIEIVEYVVGTSMKSRAWLILAPLAVVGAWPIVLYFMHINQLKHLEE